MTWFIQFESHLVRCNNLMHQTHKTVCVCVYCLLHLIHQKFQPNNLSAKNLLNAFTQHISFCISLLFRLLLNVLLMSVVAACFILFGILIFCSHHVLNQKICLCRLVYISFTNCQLWVAFFVHHWVNVIDLNLIKVIFVHENHCNILTLHKQYQQPNYWRKLKESRKYKINIWQSITVWIGLNACTWCLMHT